MSYPKKRIIFDLDKLEIVSILGIVKQSSKSRVRIAVENYDNQGNYVAIYSEYKRDSEPDDEGYWKVSKKIKLSRLEFDDLVLLLFNKRGTIPAKGDIIKFQ